MQNLLNLEIKVTISYHPPDLQKEQKQNFYNGSPLLNSCAEGKN